MKRFALSLLSVLIVLTTFAAVTQTGYIKTRGRLARNGQLIPGKRLEAATVQLQNGSSVVSDQSGDFTLSLPANKFYLKNVKKIGYVVSDPDMLSKQYACSPNPLVLVLEEPTTQQDDKLASERQLRRNLQKQLQQREDELEALKNENKISQEQYRETLRKLYSEQESNEKFIAEMAERYSKIDFDQLSDFQKQFAAFIQNGELVRADSLLRTKGSMNDREAEIMRLRQANAKERQELALREEKLSKSEKNEALLLEDFAADCHNHFEICKLRFDNDSATYWIERRAKIDPTNIDWLLEAGTYIEEYVADYPKAMDYFNRALTQAMIQYTENHPKVASIYNDIGLIFKHQGNYEQALENYTKALNIKRTIYEENDPDLAITYNNIGLLNIAQGDYAGALENLERTLKIFLNAYGKDHTDVANTYNNLGSVYESLGKYAIALENYEKAMNIWRGIYGEINPKTAISYNNIAVLYTKYGNYSEALEYLEKALNIFQRVYGEKHPDVANAYNNIGVTCDNQGDHAAALENYEKALNI